MNYRARFYNLDSKWIIERELMCINGLKAWFVIASVDEPTEEEMGYSEGSIGSAETRARLITDALNRKQKN